MDKGESMQVKKFVAPNMRLALKQIREELGPDTIILSNKRVPEGVELMTAIDEPVREAAPAESAPEPQAPIGEPSKLELEVGRMQREARQRAEALAATLNRKNQQAFSDAMGDSPQASHAQGDDYDVGEEKVDLSFSEQLASVDLGDTAEEQPKSNSQADSLNHESSEQLVQSVLAASEAQMSQMREELQSMRAVLEQQLSTMAWGQFANDNPERASLWRRLTRMGIDSVVADQLLDQPLGQVADKPAWSQLMHRLQQDIPVSHSDMVAKGGVFAFVGPTGAGKTTTIGKLAARYVIDNGTDDIALVTTDTVRIAGHEQLRTVGRILNIPVQVVDQNNSLERVLYGLRHKKLVLVDTAGFSRQDDRLAKQLLAINELGERAKTLLVLPSSSQLAVIKAAYHSYRTDNLSACVITKVDETACLGGVLSLAIEKQLPIAYSSDGQDIPGDLNVADKGDLLRKTIELAKHQTINDQAMSEEYSAVKIHSR